MQTIVVSNNEYFVNGQWRTEKNADLSLSNGVYRVEGDWVGFWIQEMFGHRVFTSIEEVTEQMHICEMQLQQLDPEHPEYDRICYTWDMMKVVREKFKLS